MKRLPFALVGALLLTQLVVQHSAAASERPSAKRGVRAYVTYGGNGVSVVDPLAGGLFSS